MDRRKFIKTTAQAVSIGLVGCGVAPSRQSLLDTPAELQDMQTFAYYQAFYGSQTISDLRPNGDGTTYNMPVLTAAQVQQGREIIDEEFWHSHGQKHRFSITREHYAKLLQGETVYVFTTEADGHWHCIRIVPKFRD